MRAPPPHASHPHRQIGRLAVALGLAFLYRGRFTPSAGTLMRDDSPSDRTVDLEDFETRAAATTRGQLIVDGSPTLSNAQRKYLRGLGQPLHPLVMIGARGPVRSVAEATEAQLEAHELIKIKIHESASLRPEVVALWLRGETGAEIVHVLGHTALLYKARAQKPTIKLPK